MESLCNQESPGTWPSCSPRVLRPGTRAAEPLVCPWAPGDPALRSERPGQGRDVRIGDQGCLVTLATKGDVEQPCLPTSAPVSADGDSLRRCK